MAYLVAKELSLRPLEILTTWSCEELLVAYGVYANAHSKEAYDMKSKADRRKEKLTWLDRWAVPFFTQGQMSDFGEVIEEENKEAEELTKIAETLFS